MIVVSIAVTVTSAGWAIVVLIVIAISSFAAVHAVVAIHTLAKELAAACTETIAWRTARTAEPTTAFAVTWRWRTIGATRTTEASAAFFTIATAGAFTIAWRTRAIAVSHPWTIIGTALGEHMILGSTAAKSATFSRRSWWTAAVGKARTRPVFVNELGECFEFFFAQLIVVVLIELREHLFGFRHHWMRTTGATRTAPTFAITGFWSAPLGSTATSFRTPTFWAGTSWTTAARFRSATFGWTTPAFAGPAIATFTAVTTEFSHFVARFFALVVAELAVAVFVELFQYFLAHFSAVATVAFFAFLVARFSTGRNRQQSQREKDHA